METPVQDAPVDEPFDLLRNPYPMFAEKRRESPGIFAGSVMDWSKAPDIVRSFDQGTVTASLGAPPIQAEVRIQAEASLLDGMLTGRVHAMRAAMSGKLVFSGDARLAMGIQRIQGDLSRLYTLSRQTVLAQKSR